MTRDRKEQPSKRQAAKKPRVKKETVKDLDPKTEAENVKGGITCVGTRPPR